MWKHDVNDMQTMYNRDTFLDCYQDIFKYCSEHAPWHIVPADKNWYKEYVVVKRLVSEMKKLPLEYPTLSGDDR
jgi:polyphosphate kinase 2 (PPK2 family)